MKWNYMWIGLLILLVGSSVWGFKQIALQSQAFNVDGKTGATSIANQFKKEKQFPFEIVQLLYAGSPKGIGRAFRVEEDEDEIRLIHPKVHFFDRAYALHFDRLGHCKVDSLKLEKKSTLDFVEKMNIILNKKEDYYEVQFQNPLKNEQFKIAFILDKETK